MVLSKIEIDDIMGSVSVELESMFDKLSSQYIRPDISKYTLLLTEIEAHIKASLLTMDGSSTPRLVD